MKRLIILAALLAFAAPAYAQEKAVETPPAPDPIEREPGGFSIMLLGEMVDPDGPDGPEKAALTTVWRLEAYSLVNGRGSHSHDLTAAELIENTTPGQRNMIRMLMRHVWKIVADREGWTTVPNPRPADDDIRGRQ